MKKVVLKIYELRRVKMKRGEIRIIKSVLQKRVGWSWPVLLFKSLLKGRSIYKNTHWAKEKGEEAMFDKRLSFSSALYIELQKKFNKENSFDIMRKIIVPMGCNEQLKNTKSLNILNKEPMEQLLSFYGFMGIGGVGKFVIRKLIKANNDILHYEVRDCFFARFYKETGTPELTKLFCEVDTEFFPKAFPDFKFHRGGSLENTVAYGKDHCVFIFERRKK